MVKDGKIMVTFEVSTLDYGRMAGVAKSNNIDLKTQFGKAIEKYLSEYGEVDRNSVKEALVESQSYDVLCEYYEWLLSNADSKTAVVDKPKPEAKQEEKPKKVTRKSRGTVEEYKKTKANRINMIHSYLVKYGAEGADINIISECTKISYRTIWGILKEMVANNEVEILGDKSKGEILRYRLVCPMVTTTGEQTISGKPKLPVQNNDKEVRYTPEILESHKNEILTRLYMDHNTKKVHLSDALDSIEKLKIKVDDVRPNHASLPSAAVVFFKTMCGQGLVTLVQLKDGTYYVALTGKGWTYINKINAKD